MYVLSRSFGLNNRPRAAVGRTGIYGRGMDDKQIMAHIDELIDTEHQLRRQLAAGELTSQQEGELESGGAGRPPRPGLTIAELYGHPFGVDPGGVRLTGNRYPLAEVRLLAPVLPSKVVAAGRNYASHAREIAGEPPAEPVIFLKPSTSVTGPGDAIKYPVKPTARVDFGG